ncbi:DUF3800 domain-containing protein [Mucilaginibacter jinjuensis]|uniref:DUF3800 domain-containing protein n=1 Tax=Mucilaginibacter jinjuensis TaxID=1176721 RepID=A0ABY7T6L0_9SPHI|nr:DUF3800 domain-containing protein [Mucilaginibacter jinjuensis]WCT12125.1 DUF3800 domain-containing protein [Mucilaginibacter jinjuensis]
METPNLNDDSINLNENAEPEELNEKQLAKLQKIEEEKKDLLNRVLSGQIENIKDRVAFVLNNSNDARNSDVELAWSYWYLFETEILNGVSVTKEQLKGLTKISSLSRMRAKIQNEYKLFQADEKVRKFRGVLQEKNRQAAIADKPSGLGTYTVYIDETGKTQDYLSVGSMWVLKSFKIDSRRQLLKWKEDREINYEFHFNEITKNKASEYKEFFTKFLSIHPEVGFKVIVVNNKGLSNKNAAITDLTSHLLIKGVLHENETGRAPLPRILSAWIDEEEAGSDQLKIENIKERISQQKIKGLYAEDFQAISSKSNFYIQVVDLFTGAINRKLNTPQGNHPKDEVADFILDMVKFDLNSIDKNNSDVDQSTVFNLLENSQ